jgi:hypothetical protein
MPPQQRERLLDLPNATFGFSAHVWMPFIDESG